MATKTFSAKVDAFIAKSQARTEAVFKTAVQDVLNDANTTKPGGGRLPIDTGFLRNSLGASLSGMPAGPTRPEEGRGSADQVALVIAGAKLGDTIYAGWTAIYARVQEMNNGFLEAAVQRWPQRVNAAVERAKQEFR